MTELGVGWVVGAWLGNIKNIEIKNNMNIMNFGQNYYYIRRIFFFLTFYFF